MKIEVTILILTFKGKHHLIDLLPSVDKVINKSPDYDIQVEILDNGCDEATRKYVNNSFPSYRYHFSEKNEYLFSLNPFIHNLSRPFFLLLNDDMYLDDDVINKNIPLLENDSALFAVNCQLINWNGIGKQNNFRYLMIRKGWAYTGWSTHEFNNPIYTLYAGGGSAIFRTTMFNQLGGFNDLYKPAYCEDLDLSHRAWHRGWKVVFQPDAIIYHKEGATLKEQYRSEELATKIYKNRILWMLATIDARYFIIQFFLFFPIRLITFLFTHRVSFKALLLSIRKMPKALSLRSARKEHSYQDCQLIKNFFGKEYQS